MTNDRTVGNHSDKRQQASAKSRLQVDESAGSATDSGMDATLMDAAVSNSSINTEIAQLRDPRFPIAQRLALAARIGEIRGNRFLKQSIPFVDENSNAKVQAFKVSQENLNRLVQRDDKPGAGPSVSIEKQGNKVAVAASGEWPIGEIPTKYAKFGGSVIFGGNVEVEFPEAESSDGGGSPVSKEVKLQAKEVAIKYAKSLWEKDKNSTFVIKSIQFKLNAAGKGPGKEGGEASIDTGVEFEFEHGLTATGTVTLLKVTDPKQGDKPFDVKIGEIEGQGTETIEAFKDLPFDKYKVSGSGNFGLKFTAAPNIEELLWELMAEHGAEVLARFGITPLNAVRNIMASGPALIGFLGAYITVKATLATLEDGDEEAKAASEAHQAIDGYHAGYMTHLGQNVHAGSTTWFVHGFIQAYEGISAQINKIQTNPLFAQYHFQDSELRQAIHARVMENPEDFQKMLVENVDWQIKWLYVQKFRDSRTLAQNLLTDTEAAERRVRLRLGLDLDQPIPDLNINPPSSPPVEPAETAK